VLALGEVAGLFELRAANSNDCCWGVRMKFGGNWFDVILSDDIYIPANLVRGVWSDREKERERDEGCQKFEKRCPKRGGRCSSGPSEPNRARLVAMVRGPRRVELPKAWHS